jgi:hypothetical protein
LTPPPICRRHRYFHLLSPIPEEPPVLRLPAAAAADISPPTPDVAARYLFFCFDAVADIFRRYAEMPPGMMMPLRRRLIA